MSVSVSVVINIESEYSDCFEGIDIYVLLSSRLELGIGFKYQKHGEKWHLYHFCRALAICALLLSWPVQQMAKGQQKDEGAKA